MAEVICVHGGHVGLGISGPRTHLVRVLLSEVLDRNRGAAVGVALTQNWVDGGALDGVVLLLSLFVLRKVVAGGLQLSDGLLQLHQGSGDVRQLNDVGFRGLGQLAKLSQGIGDLLVTKALRELGQDAAGQGNVAGFYLDARSGGEGLYDRLEGVGRQQRRLVGTGPDNLCHGSPKEVEKLFNLTGYLSCFLAVPVPL